jgi:hypothetical protein
MGFASPAANCTAPALQFVPVELPRAEPMVDAPASQPDIRIELHYGGLRMKLECAAGAGTLHAVQLRALADALCGT